VAISIDIEDDTFFGLLLALVRHFLQPVEVVLVIVLQLFLTVQFCVRVFAIQSSSQTDFNSWCLIFRGLEIFFSNFVFLAILFPFLKIMIILLPLSTTVCLSGLSSSFTVVLFISLLSSTSSTWTVGCLMHHLVLA